MRTEILLYEGFEELDAFGPFEVLAVAGFEPSLVTLAHAERVTGAYGATVVPLGVLGERPARLARRHQTRDLLAPSRDRDLLARRYAFEQAGQVRLGLVDADGLSH